LGDPIEVWLIEDNEAYRNTIAKVVRRLEGVRCPRTFAACEEALEEMAIAVVPKVILLDIGLPGMSGLEGIRRLKDLAPEARIIMLTAFDDHDRIFRAICAGASGYLLKTAPVARVTEAIRDVLAGGAPMSPQIASAVLKMFAHLAAPQPNEYHLSPREKETLERMVQGITMKEIADKLGVSYHTVDTYIRNIYAKLHVQSRSGAVAKALKERLF
jgi:DNA-binding NarL/FixJ family response regulator